MSDDHGDEDKINYSEEFIKSLKNYAMDFQSRQKYYDFDMEKFLKSELEAVNSAKNKLIRFLKQYKRLDNSKVLEIGCGRGGISVAFALEGSEVYSIDFNPNELEVAKLRAKEHGVKIIFNCCDARNLPFTSNSFDVVVCRQVLQHIFPKRDQIEALKESFRVLKKGGLLYIRTPNQRYPKDHHDTGLWFVHWLPKKIALPYIKMRGQYVPGVDKRHYLSYSKLIQTLKEEGDIQVLTNFFIYKDLNEFYTDKKGIINKSFKYRIRYRSLRIISKFINLNRLLPIKIIIRKTGEQKGR